jgi:hypothetical protein
MDKTSTLTAKCVFLLTVVTVFSFSFARAQNASPQLRFASPVLVSGTNGQKDATYKFTDVIEGVDAFVTIEDIANGAILVNIDDSTLGYYDAWQPTIGGPGTFGSSSITWSIEFQNTSGSNYKFPLMDLTAVDIDGDNVRLREFIDMAGQSGFDVPTVIPSLLTISSGQDDGNGGHDGDDDGHTVHVLGPIANRTGIDTASLDVKMNYHFINQSKITVTIGAEVDDNGTTGGIATDRYSSLYFRRTSDFFTVLPVRYQVFNAILNNNTVDLSWSTDVQPGNDHFEVERSFDQANFSTVGIVLGAQPGNGVLNQYSFKDGSPQTLNHTVVYYRLKQVNADQKFSYSVVKTVRIKAVTKALVEVSPNPYMDKLKVSFVSNEQGNAEVRLVSVSGNLVKIAASAAIKGYNSIELKDLQSQAPGIYIANIIINNKPVASVRVMKQ